MAEEYDLSTDEGFEAAIQAQAASQGVAITQVLPESVEETPEPQAVEPEIPSEPQLEERARDDKGRYIKKEEFGEMILGKFKTPEEAIRGYEELSELVGRQSQELGELRKQIQTQQTPQVAGDWFSQLAEQNPQQAAVWALNNNQTPLYEQVMDYWYDNDAKNASRFESQLLVAQERQRWESQFKPYQEQHGAQSMNEALRSVAVRIPDVYNQMEGMLQTAKEFPYIVRELEAGNPSSREKAIEALYYLANARGTVEPAEPAAAQPKQVPYVAGTTGVTEEKPLTAQDVLRSQLFPENPDLFEMGIRRPQEG